MTHRLFNSVVQSVLGQCLISLLIKLKMQSLTMANVRSLGIIVWTIVHAVTFQGV